MKFKEECGIFGVFGHPEAANLTYLGLYALQHRGQEGAGICSSNGKYLFIEKKRGLVSDIFHKKRLKRLPGFIAIGHNRYSTLGKDVSRNIQPFVSTFSLGFMAVSHNGTLSNAKKLRKHFEKEGAIFQSSNSDSEIIMHIIAHSNKKKFEDRIIEAMHIIKGAFCFLILKENELIVVRDNLGFRPLSLGEYEGAYVVASESCAFDIIGANFIRDINPGELLIINKDGLHSKQVLKSPDKKHCVFEFIYFSRPDSDIFGGINVNAIRKRLGKQLAKESTLTSDLVIPVPDSGVPTAIGFAKESGIPFDFGLVRNHYVGRTFIEPEQSIRYFGTRIKLNPVRKLLKGKRVTVIDDSIVRGTTSKRIIEMIRKCNPEEVHLRISSPAIKYPCYYGINTPTKKELIASNLDISKINSYLGTDSLAYLSLDGLKEVIPEFKNFCYACFDGKYPI